MGALRRWIDPAWIAAYGGMCLAHGFQFGFGALAAFGVSWTWVQGAVEIAAFTFVLGLPGFAMVVTAHHATLRAPVPRRVAALGLAVVAGAAVFAETSALWNEELLAGGPALLPRGLERAADFVMAFTFGSGLAALLAYAHRTSELEARAREAALAPGRREAADTEARLRQLRSQIEPHFLFNTLANVKRLGEGDPGEAGKLLVKLADYIESALSAERMERHLVSDEVAMARAYLDILSLRMGERLKVEFDVPGELESALLPPLLLATLIENAIKHGLGPRAEGGTLRLQFRREGGRLEASVSDDGVGFREHSGSGIGLANTRARLRAIYGDAAGLALLANPGGGVVARLRLPLEVAA